MTKASTAGTARSPRFSRELCGVGGSGGLRYSTTTRDCRRWRKGNRRMRHRSLARDQCGGRQDWWANWRLPMRDWRSGKPNERSGGWRAAFPISHDQRPSSSAHSERGMILPGARSKGNQVELCISWTLSSPRKRPDRAPDRSSPCAQLGKGRVWDSWSAGRWKGRFPHEPGPDWSQSSGSIRSGGTESVQRHRIQVTGASQVSFATWLLIGVPPRRRHRNGVRTGSATGERVRRAAAGGKG
jgi:hypothetical protein